MVAKKEFKILRKMLQKSCITSKELEDTLGVSNKTTRKLISQLNDEIKIYGAEIEAKPGKGYSLTIKDEKSFSFFVSRYTKNVGTDLEGRTEFLVKLFIESSDYVKIENLAEMLFVSNKVISKSIKKAEEILNSFNLYLERRPHYGIRLVANEYDIRRCLLSFESENDFGEINSRIAAIVDSVFIKNKIKMSETALSTFLSCLQISVERIKKGRIIEPDKLLFNFLSDSIFQENLCAAEECAKLIEEEFNIRFTKGEIYYIALHISDKKYYENKKDNIVIDEEISKLVTDILKNIYDTYGLDFRGDLDIYMLLVNHLIPLRLRLQHGNMIKNPILQEVNEKYKFALSIASGLNPIIEQYFHKRISEDELSYIAIAIEFAIEKHKKNVNNKKNILLVCASGNVFARFFKYHFQELFKDCIEHAYSCDYADLFNYDFSNVDYVFSTVPIDIKLPVSIYQVEYFLDENVVDSIKTILTHPTGRLAQYFSNQLFMTGIYAKSKQEVIKIMCDYIAKVENVPPDFYNLVMKREHMLHTALGNQVAIPHPYRTITENSFVCVCILAESVHWNTEKVRVVFLVSIARNSKDNLEKFYNDLFKLALTRKNIDDLIKEPTFDNFIRLINTI